MTGKALPAWARDLAGQAERVEIGGNDIFRVRRSRTRLVVSFCADGYRDHPEQDWGGWMDRYAADRAASHWSVYAPDRAAFFDPALRDALSAWARDREGEVMLVGADHAGAAWAALCHGAAFEDARIIGLSPDSVQDEAEEIVAALSQLGQRTSAQMICDFLDRTTQASIGPVGHDRLTFWNGVGLGRSLGLALRRLEYLPDLLDEAWRGPWDQHALAHLLRDRRTLYIYRQSMEAHLDLRGRETLKTRFTAAFKQQARARKTIRSADPAAIGRAAQARLVALQTAAVPSRRWRDWPRTRGNVWMLEQTAEGTFRYLSDQYQGRLIGYEERDGVTLAQSPPIARVMISIGGQSAMTRPLPERFEWHVVDEQLARGPGLGAVAHGVAAQRLSAARGHAFMTIIALSQPQGSIVADDAEASGPLMQSCFERVKTATTALERRDKTVFADRIVLSLLDGAPATDPQTASRHYLQTARTLRGRVCAITGQASPPLVVVSQTPATGDVPSPVALAEGRLDIDHPASGFLVATPRYPFAHTAVGRMLVDEMEARAVDAVLDGQRWFCPYILQARQIGRTVIADVATMDGLEFEDVPAGFALHGRDDPPTITGISVEGSRLRLDLDRDADLAGSFLTYAWGGPGTGTLRDRWSAESVLAPGQILHRYALASRTAIMPSDLGD